MEITNLDNDDNEPTMKYIFTPCRILFSGKSGCGKSNTMFNLLYKYLFFDKYYIYSKYLNDKSYQKLIKHFEKINKKLRKKLKDDSYSIYIASDDPEDLVTEAELKEHPEESKLIIIDDFFLDPSIKKRARELFTSCRHVNASIFYTSQSYNRCDKIIRENCNYLCMWKTNSKGEIMEIAKRLVPELSYKQFMALFNEITEIPYSFLCIDTSNQSEIFPQVKLRRNFDEFIDIEKFKEEYENKNRK